MRAGIPPTNPKWVRRACRRVPASTSAPNGRGIAGLNACGNNPQTGDVLTATGQQPASGCGTGVIPASGAGTISAVDGKANSGSSTWKVSVDGPALACAAHNKGTNAGDAVSLRWGP